MKGYFKCAWAIALSFIGNLVIAQSWQVVGSAEFSNGQATFTSVAIDGNNTAYVAYADGGYQDKATVMKYNGTNWVNVGSPGFSVGTAYYISLSILNNIPYVVYQDGGNSNKTSVMKYDGINWVAVGTQGFSVGVAKYTSISTSSGSIYVCFTDGGYGDKARVMYYDGSNWISLGSTTLTSGAVTQTKISKAFNGPFYLTYLDANSSLQVMRRAFVSGVGATWAWAYQGGGQISNYVSVATSPVNSGYGKFYVSFSDGSYSQKLSVWYEQISGVNPTTGDDTYTSGFIGGRGFSDGQVLFKGIAEDQSGILHTVFWDVANSSKATVKRFNGANWNNVGSTGFSLAQPGYVGIAINSAGTPYVVYQQYNVNSQPFRATVQAFLPKQNQTITFNPLATKTYGEAAFTLSATASSALPVSYSSSNTSVATVSGSSVTIVGAGTTNITASQAGDATFNAAPNVVQSLTINKASQTITFAPLPNKAVGDAPFNLTGSASSGLTVNYTSSNTAVATVSGSTITIIGVGSTTITAAQAGNSNYNPATSVQQTLTVTTAKLNQTITFNTLAAKTFGDLPFNLTATASSGLAVSYTSSDPTTATISGSTVTILKAGTVNITASQPGDATYNGASDVIRSVTINKANQTITFNALASKNVGDAPFNLLATASSGLPVTYTSSNPEVATVAGSTVAIVGGGITSITAWQNGDLNYNAAFIVIQNLTVNKLNQTISFAALSNKTVGDAPFNLTATASSGLSVSYTSSNPEVATVSGNTVTIVGVGITTFFASQAGNNMYNAAISAFQSLTVNPAKQNQTITFNALTAKTFGDASFNLTGSASSGLSVSYTSSDPTIASVAGFTVTILKAGTINITASQFGNSIFNAASEVVQSLTINKANQTITFTPFQVSNTFNLVATASSGLPVTFTSSNLAVATINGNVVTVVAAGSATITAAQPGNSNFNAAPNVTQPVVAVVTGLEPETALFAVYPNPVSEYLIIGTEHTQSKNIIVYQLDGRMVENLNTSDQEIKLSVAHYSPGMYYVKVNTKQATSILRFVKK